MKRLFDKFQIENPQKKEALFLNEKAKDISLLVKKERILWEWRSFWPETDSRISLFLRPLKISSWDDFKTVYFEDVYLIVEKHLLNLKIRKEKLVYKPLVEEYDKMLAFGHKKKIKFPLVWHHLYPLFPRLEYYQGFLFSLPDLVLRLRESGYPASFVTVQKTACRYEITPSLSLELSHIKVRHQSWYSVCVEGFHGTQVNACGRFVVAQEGERMGYAEFLHKYGNGKENR